MCGIAGAFAYHYAANPVDTDELALISTALRARGPDGHGLWRSADGRAALLHRRLAIVDLTERGAQPFVSDDGRYVISFNGEIYNYRALRTELLALGERFRSDSDTEVLLKLFIRGGADALKRLRGMYAFGVWDTLEKRFFLARDPYGIKPLYYADDGWTLRFASQVKALLASPKVSRDPEPAGHVGFFLLGSVPEPFTCYREIRALPAGSYLWVDALGPGTPQRYWHLPEVLHVPAANTADVHECIREALLDSVRHHLVSDVPVGAFLSAGIDSGALVGLMRDAGAKDICTVTLAFDEFTGSSRDEAPLAEQVARHYGTRHTTRRVSRKEFESDLPLILAAMDQPSIDGLNSWFVAKAARELGLKVAISGLGGDELFAGYPSFKDVPRWARVLKLPAAVPGLGQLTRWLGSPLLAAAGLSPKAAALLEYGGSPAGAWLLKRGLFLPHELPKIMDPKMAREGLRRLQLSMRLHDAITPDPASDYGRVAALEAGFYMRNQLLRDTDWASMAHGLEVRTPLVDATLTARIAPLLASLKDGKQRLASAPRLPLPKTITQRRKTGFTTPIDQWLQQDPKLSAWQKNPSLRTQQCPWARRWAWTLHQRFTAA